MAGSKQARGRYAVALWPTLRDGGIAVSRREQSFCTKLRTCLSSRMLKAIDIRVGDWDTRCERPAGTGFGPEARHCE